MLPSVTLCYLVLPRYPVLPRITPCYLVLHRATSCYLVLPHVTSCHLMLPRVTLCYLVLPLSITSCYLVLPRVTLCYRVLPCVTSCYVVLPCVTSCYLMLQPSQDLESPDILLRMSAIENVSRLADSPGAYTTMSNKGIFKGIAAWLSLNTSDANYLGKLQRHCCLAITQHQ